MLLGSLAPILVIIVIAQAIKVRSVRFAMQRLGFGYQKQQKSPIWIHCASVGEVAAINGLVEQLQQRLPDVPLIVSTTTPTGAEAVARRNWSNVVHQYLPVDFTYAVKKAIACSRPCALLIIETEIWPNLINCASDRGLPIAIVNGRLSKRTLNAPSWLKPVYQQALHRIDAVFSRSEKDASGFQSLGATSDRVQVVGNIKFVSVQHKSVECEVQRPFWLAASTHDNEEHMLCNALAQHPEASKVLLVIAPRHPKRSKDIQQDLTEIGVRYAVRSKSQLPDQNTQVYLADTLGEMNMWLSAAQLVFMGGSLVPVGGHNLLEPAAAGVAIVAGPHLDNVLEEAGVLTTAGAMQQVVSATDAVDVVAKLLKDSPARQSMGQAGERVMQDQTDVLQNYIDVILPLVAVK